jgi:hypothetical protein
LAGFQAGLLSRLSFSGAFGKGRRRLFIPAWAAAYLFVV